MTDISKNICSGALQHTAAHTHWYACAPAASPTTRAQHADNALLRTIKTYERGARHQRLPGIIRRRAGTNQPFAHGARRTTSPRTPNALPRGWRALTGHAVYPSPNCLVVDFATLPASVTWDLDSLRRTHRISHRRLLTNCIPWADTLLPRPTTPPPNASTTWTGGRGCLRTRCAPFSSRRHRPALALLPLSRRFSRCGRGSCPCLSSI